MNIHGDHFTIYPISCCASETNKFIYQLYLNQKKRINLKKGRDIIYHQGSKNKGKVETE